LLTLLIGVPQIRSSTVTGFRTKNPSCREVQPGDLVSKEGNDPLFVCKVVTYAPFLVKEQFSEAKRDENDILQESGHEALHVWVFGYHKVVRGVGWSKYRGSILSMPY